MICALATMMSLLMSDPPRPKPAAMVLDLKGRVMLKPIDGGARPAKLGELLYDGERLVVTADGGASVAILGVGAQERLAGGSEATVGPEGCTPPAAVAERRAQRRAVAQTMKRLRPVSGDGRKAATSVRSGDDDLPPTIAADRPGFAWPSTKGAKEYRVRLLSASGRVLWQAGVTVPKVSYPDGKESLKRGHLYRWEVTDGDLRPVAISQFLVATEKELEDLEELRRLAAGDDRADLLAAALSYWRMRCYAEAIAAFDRLATLAPDMAVYREALAELNRQAGRPGDGTGSARNAAAKDE
jgi:hypothetical protein